MIHSSSLHFFTSLDTSSLIQGYFERGMGSVYRDQVVDTDFLNKVSATLGIKNSQLNVMNQIHGNEVVIVTPDTPPILKHVDGLVTKEKSIVLGVNTADCLPIVFYDNENKVIGACHAGYKGLLVGIIQQTVQKMVALGAKKEAMRVGVGPCICKSCYTVTEDRIKLFKQTYPELEDFYSMNNASFLLDLRKIALWILQQEGISDKKVEFSPFCTKENNDLFFSRRVETNGVFLTVIGML